MTLKTFTKITLSSATGNVTGSDFNRLQDSIQASLQPLISKIQLDSNVIQGVSLSQGTVNNVPHMLGRVPITFKPVLYGQADVWYAQAADSNFLYLMCSSNVTIDFEVS